MDGCKLKSRFNWIIDSWKKNIEYSAYKQKLENGQKDLSFS